MMRHILEQAPCGPAVPTLSAFATTCHFLHPLLAGTSHVILRDLDRVVPSASSQQCALEGSVQGNQEPGTCIETAQSLQWTSGFPKITSSSTPEEGPGAGAPAAEETLHLGLLNSKTVKALNRVWKEDGGFSFHAKSHRRYSSGETSLKNMEQFCIRSEASKPTRRRV